MWASKQPIKHVCPASNWQTELNPFATFYKKFNHIKHLGFLYTFLNAQVLAGSKGRLHSPTSPLLAPVSQCLPPPTSPFRPHPAPPSLRGPQVNPSRSLPTERNFPPSFQKNKILSVSFDNDAVRLRTLCCSESWSPGLLAYELG